ncbi:MAG TPA: PilZ domain-containing protein [Terriglobales bacterium]|nr:PilZ domain-containing protein [Terriglobales bacterium]
MEIQLNALVCSADQRTVKVLQVLLGEMSIAMELCASRDDAARHLVTRRFDGVFVDGAIERSADLLRDIKESPGGQRAVSFAILEGMTSVKEAFTFGAGFILYKPLSIEKTKTSLRAAHGLMMRERRRHFRHNLEDVAATLMFTGAPNKTAEILDLSEGGMALRLSEYTERRGQLRARFLLPGHAQPLEAEGEITWADDHGRVGVHFTSMADSAQGALVNWLAERGRVAAEDPHAAIQSRSSKKKKSTGGRVGAVQEVVAAVATSDKPAAPAPAPEETLPRARQSIRAGLDVGLSVVTIRSGQPVLLQAVCEDISSEGLGAKVHGDLAPGEPVLLHLSLPSLESMKVHADVRHRRRSRVGFEFVGLTREQHKQLTEVCEVLPAAE